MFNSIVYKVDISEFPNSFQLLQQEAMLTDSSLLSGFEYLVKGSFEDKGKGAYYAAFFDLSIGFERLMKLVIITHFMVENDFKSYDPKELRKYGHDLKKLFKKSIAISREYGVNSAKKDSDDLNDKILKFLTDFADAQKGRYFNINNTTKQNDPIILWKSLLDKIARQDFSETDRQRLESETFNNISLKLQLEDIAKDTGYVDSIYQQHKTLLANHYVLWRIINLLKPLALTLGEISTKCHEIETSTSPKNYPSIPYFNEFFLFSDAEIEEVMRRKRWTDLFYS